MGDPKSTAGSVVCRWCNTVMRNDVGAYYHKKQCEQRVLLHAKALYQEWLDTRGDRPSAQFCVWLDARVESARYVGD